MATGGFAGALAFSERAEAAHPPALLTNIWFEIGAALVALGFLVALLVPLALITHARKSVAFESLLADSDREGRQLHARSGSDLAEVRPWVDRVHALIESGLGPGHAALFLSDSGYVFYSDGKHQAQIWVEGRLRRLSELLARLSALQVRMQFRPNEWTDPK